MRDIALVSVKKMCKNVAVVIEESNNMSDERKEGIDFNLWVANFYVSKVKTTKEAGIEFSLTLQQVANMLKAKKCFLTGIPLTHSNGSNPRATDVTIDRLDNTKGYVKGNVHAVCRAANAFKGTIENPNAVLKSGHMLKIIRSIK